jgi:translation initiation factor IF-1
MPVNKQGGKGCKKGKNGTKEDDNVLMVECNANDGQMFGRVLKPLGDRRFTIFCNDYKERVCKLAGSIRKNDRVEKGGIVLLSLRDLSLSATELGDIISTVDSRLYGKLKKLEGINPLLFANVEDQDSSEVARRVKAMEQDDEDLFDRGGETEGEGEEEEEDGDANAEKVLTKEDIAEIEKKKVKEQLDREKKRKAKYEEDVRIEDL